MNPYLEGLARRLGLEEGRADLAVLLLVLWSVLLSGLLYGKS